VPLPVPIEEALLSLRMRNTRLDSLKWLGLRVLVRFLRKIKMAVGMSQLRRARGRDAAPRPRRAVRRDVLRRLVPTCGLAAGPGGARDQEEPATQRRTDATNR
jgi:hypothetical protein